MANFSPLETAILKTLAHFDIFDYPLTLVEIHKWLYQPDRKYIPADIKEALAGNNLSALIETETGFYFFSGRGRIISQRLKNYRLAEKKYKIARRAARWLSRLKNVRYIAVCNKTGYNNASAASDIDFFIIIKSGRLWSTRFFVTLLMTMLGIRRHDSKYIDRVCLSFYITDSHLDLADITLKPHDPHLVFWLASFTPVYDKGCGEKFFAANAWLAESLPNYYPPVASLRRRVQPVAWPPAAARRSRQPGFAERLFEIIQAPKIKKYFGSMINQPDHNVVITPTIMKFHKNDRRLEYCRLWREKLNKLGVEI